MKKLIAALLLLASSAFALDFPGLEITKWKVREHSVQSKIVFWKYTEMSFKDGQFVSSRFRELGFEPAVYTHSKSGDTVAWTATQHHPDKGKVVWEGRRTGEVMEGTWTWLKADGKRKTMSWSAKMTDYQKPLESSPLAP